MDTICAIATPSGIGGISIIRLSGKDSLEILSKVFFCNTSVTQFEPRKMYLGNVVTPRFTDKGLAVYFAAPNSYTGEDVVELHLHGGKALTIGTLNTLYDKGATPAQAGEFTKRAFLNGKLSLSGAEGVIDMINAESEASVKAGFNLLNGRLSQTAERLQEQLKHILSEFFMYINHLDEDIDRELFSARLNEILCELKNLQASYRVGKMIKDGVNVCIVGKPNVGKSSILNKLLNFDRAIVTEIAGTTRDTLEAGLTINGIKINLIDTAGIRDTSDIIEKVGIERSIKAIESSNISVWVVDGSSKLDAYDFAILEKLQNRQVIEVINKSDKGIVIQPKFDCNINCNAITGDGIEQLKSKLYELICDNGYDENSVMLTNERHYNVICRAILQVQSAIDNIQNYTDCVDIEVEQAYQILGEITGSTASEDIIDLVFSKFCLGK